MANRPFLITLIGGLTLLVGLVLVLVGALLFFTPDSAFADVNLNIKAIDSLGAGALVLGIIFLVVAFAFLKGWTIAWYLGILIHGVDVILSLMMFPLGIVSMVLSLLIIYYLFRPHVKEFFGV